MNQARTINDIYNPHQAGWDEGYAEGLAAGRGAVETKTTKEFEEVKLDVAYLRRCLEYHVDYFGRVTTNPRQITVESQVINRVLKAIPTAPTSGEGSDVIEAALVAAGQYKLVGDDRSQADRIVGLADDALRLHREKCDALDRLDALAAQIATLQAALEAKDQAIAELLSGASGETHKLRAALEKAKTALSLPTVEAYGDHVTMHVAVTIRADKAHASLAAIAAIKQAKDNAS